MSVVIKTPEQIAIMAESGRIAASALQEVLKHVRPGVTTNELDVIFEELVRGSGAEPAFLGYQGFSKSLCTSVNDQVVHGIPGNRVLQEGDIIGVDAGARYKGYCSDMSRTVAVGKISAEAQQLIDVTQEAMMKGIAQCVVGNTIGDISHAVQQYAESFGYGVVRMLVGHGIGVDLHEDPSVPNYGSAATGLALQEGMVLAIEPMINIGGPEVVFEEDGWTVSTSDGSLSAHFENTVAITRSGPRILTA